MRKLKFLPTGEVVYKGVKYPGFTALNDNVTFDPDKWKKFWKNKINEIKKMKLDFFQIEDIHSSFVKDGLMYGYTKQMVHKHQDYGELSTELKIALHQAYSNYCESKKGFWGFISGIFVNKLIDRLPNPFALKKEK